jgi:hypothetical protein
MGCCCTKTLHLCKVDSCEGFIDLGVNAVDPGDYVLEVDFAGVTYRVKATIAAGQPIKFPANELNEDHVFEGKVFHPNGDRLNIEKNAVVYDCVMFETGIVHTIEEA